MRVRPRILIALILASAGAAVAGFTLAQGSDSLPAPTTPIEHVVVIFGENESFDHYFGTYPHATNPAGEPVFNAAVGTPVPDNYTADPNLVSHNPNAFPPERLSRSQALTCDNNHNYADEQMAFNHGAMDKFVQYTAGGGCTDKSIVMDYFDGNTVTALWNLAQHFTMSDAHFETTFGPSTPGAINLISGNTHGASPVNGSGVSNGTDIGDPDPMGDDCANGSMTMSGDNIGDRMKDADMTWGWFQGGFRPTSTSGGKATCGARHANIGGGMVTDYSAHHQPFQYYPSTANPHHLPPSSASAIGSDDQANHQYDLIDFDTAVKYNKLPQVSFVKAASFEDAHPGNSDPLDEQRFIARTLDELQQSPQWSSTAVIITYDDSDGWYDHAFTPPTNPSNSIEDGLNGPGQCGVGVPADTYQNRCGPGPRLPLLIVSPWVAPNTVNHTQIDQTSIIKFIESNWSLPPIGGGSFDAQATDLQALFDFNLGHARAPVVYLDPETGRVVGSPPAGLTSAPTQPTATTTTTTTDVTPPPVVPVPTPIPPTTTTTTTPAPPPRSATPVRVRLSLTTKKRGKRLTVKLHVTGLSASKGKITLSAKLARGKTSIATGKGTVKSGRLTLTLKAKKTLKAGTYTLTVTVTQAKKSTKFSRKLKLK